MFGRKTIQLYMPSSTSGIFSIFFTSVENAAVSPSPWSQSESTMPCSTRKPRCSARCGRAQQYLPAEGVDGLMALDPPEPGVPVTGVAEAGHQHPFERLGP